MSQCVRGLYDMILHYNMEERMKACDIVQKLDYTDDIVAEAEITNGPCLYFEFNLELEMRLIEIRHENNESSGSEEEEGFSSVCDP